MFGSRVPSPDEIAARISEITSHAVAIDDSTEEDEEVSLWEYQVRLKFDAVPECALRLYAYKPGAVDKWMDDDDPMLKKVLGKSLEGAGERKGHRFVHFLGYIGEEPTLFFVTDIALHDLGGTTEKPIPDDIIQEYKREISVEELQSRLNDVKSSNQKQFRWILILSPLLIPLWIISMVFTLLLLPFRLLWAWRQLSKLKENGTST